MCTRYTQTHELAALARRFGFAPDDMELKPRYNQAPGQTACVVTAHGGRRRLEAMSWGLAPSWAKGASKAPRSLNARAETVTEKPSFRSPFRHRRCLVPADGFYEWQKAGGGARRPWLFRLETGGLFAFAGIWGPGGGKDAGAGSFAVITTKANGLVARIHDRMPVILHPGQEQAWLEASPEQARELTGFLQPYPAGLMASRPVSAYVNSTAHEGPKCIEPAPEQVDLFS